MLADRFNRIAKVLADPCRFALLERIAREPETACTCLVGEFTVTPATISHHVRELADAGLITMRKQGKCGFFRYNPRAMAAYQRELLRRLGHPPPDHDPPIRRKAATVRKTVRPVRARP